MSTHDQVVKILGENNITRASVTTRGSKGAVAVEILDASGNQISIPSGFVSETYDTIDVTYTDSSKQFISSVVYSLNGNVVATITVTYPSDTTEKYTTL